ncbi:SAP domain-containing protein [Nannizzia gypsea CBS 118893]|uniref:SAP domain-containing protein n=1 Tax=Arthroderma gypseum (strain ATCC MYA-4604 / CBS 118893) TaxID=535722 RepID=E4UX34_ARTGP|nr:SAP domain-containing protein [Nannizzia gypsea CBS 118893]EFR01834.1 SAP domain-containing protein [Nannizzia gypsea CBS 118893]
MVERERIPDPTMPSPVNCPVPIGSDYAAPAYPGRPDLFDDIEWGPFPSEEDIKKAYKVWSIPNSTLKASHPLTNVPAACLVRNVYESILASPNLPILQENWAFIPPRDAERTDGWTYNEIFGTEPEVQEDSPDDSTSSILVQGHNPLTDTRYWTKAKLQPELRSRGIDANGVVAVLRQRLYDDERQRSEARGLHKSEGEDKGSFLPVQPLPEWGLKRESDHFLVKITTKSRLSALDMYTWSISLSPYNPTFWTSRAYLYYQMGHFDLAIGDAYRAQLLCEKLVNPLNRHAQPGFYIRIWDAIERHILQTPSNGRQFSPEVILLRKGNGVNSFIPLVRKAVHHIIVLSLLAMQCWEDYSATEPYLTTRLIMADRDKIAMTKRQGKLAQFIQSAGKEKRRNSREYFFERHYGFITCRQYPYDTYDAATALEKIADKLNEDMMKKSQAMVYRPAKIQVDIDGFNLSVYAYEDIRKGAVIYVDEPSIRGHLQPLFKPLKHYCENCMRQLNTNGSLSPSPTGKMAVQDSSCTCSSSTHAPLYWCSADTHSSESTGGRRRISAETDDGRRGNPSKRQKTSDVRVVKQELSCLDIAKSLYHNRACGKNWNWLHNAMRPNYWNSEFVPRELGSLSHSNEKHGTILSLLLREVFDITLLRRKTDNKPNLLAHEIDELMPTLLWPATGKNLPFSFAANIQVPFDILSCLGVNIFRDLSFDTWVIQLVLRKLLMSAIPWHALDEGRSEDIPESQLEIIKRTREISKLTPQESDLIIPTFPNLYVFPAVSVFKHACPPYHNVDWNWDTEIPNRLILHANRFIRHGEELVIRYTKAPLPKNTAVRLFGTICNCPGCGEEHSRSPETPDYFGFGTSDESQPESSPDPEPPAPLQGPSTSRWRSPEPNQDTTSGDNDTSPELRGRRNGGNLDGGADTDNQEQDELEDYKSSSQEESALQSNVNTYQGRTPFDYNQARESQLRNQTSDDDYQLAAQLVLETIPDNPQPESREGQHSQLREESHKSFSSTAARNSMPPPPQGLDPRPSLLNPSHAGSSQAPSRRRGGATVRHKGVIMSSYEYNQLIEREKQQAEQGRNQQKDRAGDNS